MSDDPLIDWKATTEILLSDATRAESDVVQNGDDYSKRNYVRSAFAFVEGSVYGMRRLILHMQECRPLDLTTEDQEFLRDETPAPNGGFRKRFLPFKDNLIRTIELFSKAHRFSFSPDYSQAWIDLLNAHKIRNRLVHPKCIDDLRVSGEDLATIQRGVQWYIDTRSKLMIPATAFVKSVALKSNGR